MSDKFYWKSVDYGYTNDKMHLLYTSEHDCLLNSDAVSIKEAPLYVAMVYPSGRSGYDYCFTLFHKRYPNLGFDGFEMAAGKLDEMKLIAEETVGLNPPNPLHWVVQLTLKQKELLLYCFSTAFCMEGSVDPLGAYLSYEGFLANPYIHPPDSNFTDDLTLLKRAMVVFIKTTAPGYEDLITTQDFDKCLDEYIKSKRGGTQ
jgi:hypothetical protein